MTMTDDTMEDPAARRARITAERRRETGIDEAMIERLVHTFYARIREHSVLGPIFNSRIQDWDDHMRRLCAFWSSVTLASGAYSGSPMRKHLGLPIDARHFDQWLALFLKTVGEICPPQQARIFMERAHRIAESLEMAIAIDKGVMLGKGERLTCADLDAAS